MLNETVLIQTITFMMQRQQAIVNHTIWTRRLVYGIIGLIGIVFITILVVWLIKRKRRPRVKRKRK